MADDSCMNADHLTRQGTGWLVPPVWMVEVSGKVRDFGSPLPRRLGAVLLGVVVVLMRAMDTSEKWA